MGFRSVNLQVDSTVVDSYFQSTSVGGLRHQSCIEDMKQLLARDWRVVVSHTYREGNRVPDLLAHHGHSLSFGMHLITSYSVEICDCIKTNMIRVLFPSEIHYF
ncbi:hypothetical protein LINGRAHAP2_LOCUS6152 [Linum grandiflorum]